MAETNNQNIAKELAPAIVFGTIVVVAIALLGRYMTRKG